MGEEDETNSAGRQIADTESSTNPITPSDRHAQRSLSAVYVDTWSAMTWKGHVRVTMGEQFSSGEDHWRFAFAMELDDAERFAIFLFGMVQKRREKDSAKAALTAKDAAINYLTQKPE